MDFSNKNIGILIAIILLMVVGFGLVIKWNLKENTVEISSAESNSKKSTIEANQSTNSTTQNLKTVKLLIICRSCEKKDVVGKIVSLRIGSSTINSTVNENYFVIFLDVNVSKGTEVFISSDDLKITSQKSISDIKIEIDSSLYYGEIPIEKNDISELNKGKKTSFSGNNAQQNNPISLVSQQMNTRRVEITLTDNNGQPVRNGYVVRARYTPTGVQKDINIDRFGTATAQFENVNIQEETEAALSFYRIDNNKTPFLIRTVFSANAKFFRGEVIATNSSYTLPTNGLMLLDFTINNDFVRNNKVLFYLHSYPDREFDALSVSDNRYLFDLNGLSSELVVFQTRQGNSTYSSEPMAVSQILIMRGNTVNLSIR